MLKGKSVMACATDQTRFLSAPDVLFNGPECHGLPWRRAACYKGALIRIAKIVGQTLKSDQLQLPPSLAQREFRFAIESEGALLWAREDYRAVELRTCQPNAEVKAAFSPARRSRAPLSAR